MKILHEREKLTADWLRTELLTQDDLQKGGIGIVKGVRHRLSRVWNVAGKPQAVRQV